MRLLLLSLLAIAAVNCDDIDLPNKKPVAKVFNPRKATYKKAGGGLGTIDAVDNKGRDAQLDAKKQQANLHAFSKGKNFQTNQSKGQVVATGANGRKSTINKVGTGGTYQAQKHQGTLTDAKEGNNRVAKLQNNGGKQKLQADFLNNGDKVDATGTKNNNWEADPSKLDKTGSVGTLKRTSKNQVYNYNVQQDGNKGSAVLDDPSKSGGIFAKSGGTKYTCTSEKSSISTCFDSNGRKVGEARTSATGDTVLTNSLNIPVATLKKNRDPKTGESTATVSGLYTATSGGQKDSNCDGMKNDKVQFTKQMAFKYANEKVSGGRTFDWPDCFQITGTIKLAPEIEPKNVAIKFIPLILPAGRLNCKDPGTEICGGQKTDCYYCDLCDAQKRGKVNLLDNQQSNLCEQKGGTIQATATVCPPPDVNTFKYCDEFKKPIGDPYWKKKGNLDVVMQVFERKSKEEFLADWKDPKKKAAIIADWKKNNPSKILVLFPNDAEVGDWYKYGQQTEIGCRESIVNYTVSSSKVNTGFLLEGATASGVLAKSQCPENPKDLAAG